MDQETLFPAHQGRWLLLLFLLACLTVLQHIRTSLPDPVHCQRVSAPTSWQAPPSWKYHVLNGKGRIDVFRGRDGTDFSGGKAVFRGKDGKDVFSGSLVGHPSDHTPLQKTRETPMSGRESTQGDDHKKQQKGQSQSTCRCPMFNRTKAGRNQVRSCRLLSGKLTFSPITVRSCPPCFSQSGALQSSRERRLQSSPWTMKSVSMVKEQTERNKGMCPDLHMNLTGRSCNKLRHRCGSRCVQHLSQTAGNQRGHEKRGKSKGILVAYIVVCLLAAWSLLLKEEPDQKALTGLKEHLLNLLPEPVLIRTERQGDGIRTTRSSCSAVRFLAPGSSSAPTDDLPSCSEKASSCYGFSRSCSKSRFPPSLEWWFNARFLAPFTRVRVAPATSFLPGMTSQGSRDLDHVGWRLATLAALPSSCSLSRVRLAEGGFHFNPSSHPSAVVCHQCPAVYSLDQPPNAPGPLQSHWSASPRCPVARAAWERNPGSTSASASFPTAPASVSGSRGRSDGQELSEDSEQTSTERSEAPVRTVTSDIVQRSSSVSSDTGYVLALAGSLMDQRLEPKVSGRHVTDSSSPSSASQQSAGVGSNENDRPRGDGRMVLWDAVYPQFCTTESRLTTFQAWPSAMAAAFPPSLMVTLGFYYAGYADCVRCFYCGVGLKSWDSQDDPLTEHLRWRPHCNYLMATKGTERIQSCLRTIDGSNEDPTEGRRSSSSDLSTARAAAAPALDSATSPAQGASSVVQQLTTMGFPSKDIDAARARLRTAGVPEDLEHLLEVLLPGTN